MKLKKYIVEKFNTPLCKVDYIILIGIVFICYFSFENLDITHTAGCSIAYLNGHFLDFYEYNAQFDLYPSYMPSTYLLFAIWNIPLKLLGLIDVPSREYTIPMIMWLKLLPTLFFAGSAIIFWKICKTLNFSDLKAKLSTFIFLTTPIAIYSQFIFGQYDSFTLFFVLLGLLYYFRYKNAHFIAAFAIALTLKYFAFMIFVPLLFLREKKVWNLIKSGIGVMILFVVETLIYHGSTEMQVNVQGFSILEYFIRAHIDLGPYQISLMIIIWGLICVYAYFKNCKNSQEEIMWAIYLATLGITSFFVFSVWHPQWLLLAAPFWVLSSVINKNYKTFFLLDGLTMLFYTMFNVNININNVDQVLLNNGLWGLLYPNGIPFTITMSDLFIYKHINIIVSILTLLFVVQAVYKHPKYMFNEVTTEIEESMGILRLRFIGGILIFLFPAFVCLFMSI